MQSNAKSVKHKIFYAFSKKAVLDAVKENKEFLNTWNLSRNIIPDSVLQEHFISSVSADEELLRIRLLICGEAYFTGEIIRTVFGRGKTCSYLDIGDSDGSARLLLKETLDGFSVETMGINLQPGAVEKIRQRGLKAECADAMEIGKTGVKYDIVSVFETLEHLPDPVGFLNHIHSTVGHRLIISVPLVVNSRVSIRYLDDRWDKNKVPTVENTHIFELSPRDWSKIFLHTGWRIEKEWVLRQYPGSGLLKIIMQYAWRKISFEGFWFVALTKDTFYKDKFRIE